MIYYKYLLKEGTTTQLCRTSKLSINAKDEDNYCMNKPEIIRSGLGFDPGAAYSLGKCNRIPGHTSSSDFLQLVAAYTIHTAMYTTQ